MTTEAGISKAATEWRLAADVTCVPLSIVNVFLIGTPGAREWVLVDAGLWGSARRIRRHADDRFGWGARPAAIVLTHAHFDHVGALRPLVEQWDVPIYVHPMEMPYLTGRAQFPPGDPSVGGGMMARMSPLYPRGPFDFRDHVQSLRADGAIPELPGWRAIYTPGHSPGHISLFRESDGVLIAGDAFVTTKQESAVAALLKPRQMHGPPAYFTPDWPSAAQSVNALAALRPSIAGTGHGRPIASEPLRRGLTDLTHNFERIAVPHRGRYVGRPVVFDMNGVVSVPPPIRGVLPKPVLGLGAVGGVGLALWAYHNRLRSPTGT